MKEKNLSSNKGLSNYIDFLIKGQRKECLNYLKEYLELNSNYIELYEEVLKKALYNVGELWAENKITVANEHLASSITEYLLNKVYEGFTTNISLNKKVIVACNEKEAHQIGAKMVADVFENNGWETFFLGANTPIEDLISLISTIKPHFLAISFSIYYNSNNIEGNISKIRTKFPNLAIIIGGQAFNHGGKELFQKFANTFFIKDLYDLDLFIKNESKVKK